MFEYHNNATSIPLRLLITLCYLIFLLRLSCLFNFTAVQSGNHIFVTPSTSYLNYVYVQNKNWYQTYHTKISGPEMIILNIKFWNMQEMESKDGESRTYHSRNVKPFYHEPLLHKICWVKIHCYNVKMLKNYLTCYVRLNFKPTRFIVKSWSFERMHLLYEHFINGKNSSMFGVSIWI